MENKLQRRYGLFTAICMVVGIVIGSGVFFKAQTILTKTGGNMPLGILAWIIEGAKKVIALDYQIPVPDCVTKAIDEYRSQNDWFGHFLDEKCDVDESFKESSSALYQAYRNYSMDCNEYIRSTADFYFALEKAGFERIKVHNKRYFKGLRLRAENDAEEDFLN